jgi:formylglycine-generating enzyme required for sulfatase activity
VAILGTMNSPTTPNLARIPAGDFFMGAADAEEDERPVHRVYVSEFLIGRYAVTQDEYAKFVRATNHPSPAIRDLPLIGRGDRESTFRERATRYAWDHDQPPSGHGSHPVVLVRYDDGVAYCRWLSDEIGRPVRLPTEAEWEKAARGGAEALKYPWGNDIDSSRANYLADPAAKNDRGTRPTGTYAPNPYGLYDMCGNVWEWASDWYGADAWPWRDARSARPGLGAARGSRRLVGELGSLDAAQRVLAQGAARHYAHSTWIRDRMRTLMLIALALAAPRRHRAAAGSRPTR